MVQTSSDKVTANGNYLAARDQARSRCADTKDSDRADTGRLNWRGCWLCRVARLRLRLVLATSGKSRDSCHTGASLSALLSEVIGGRVTERVTADVFTEFVETVEPRLRLALVAAFGPDVGLEVTAEALAYAWENWDTVWESDNPAGYLWGVGA